MNPIFDIGSFVLLLYFSLAVWFMRSIGMDNGLYIKYFTYLSDNTYPRDIGKEKRSFRRSAMRFKIVNGRLCYSTRDGEY